MAPSKQAYMPQESHNMMPQFFQDPVTRSNVGASSGIWSPAPPATPQTSSASMKSVWGSPLSVLTSSSSSGTANSASKTGSSAITTAFRSQSNSTINDNVHQSLAALAADSEPVASNENSVSSFVPSLSSNSSRLSSRRNSQTEISSSIMANSSNAMIAGGVSTVLGANSASSQHSKSIDHSNDEIINTAIVVKNIPFAIKKEQLIDFMTQLGLPLPYAFNYHFDNGVFRGLAFANFTTANETAAVITTLNGRELGGRKLRVEYKKMLPFQERERIEREKRERRGQLEEQHQHASNSKQQNQTHSQKLRPDSGSQAIHNADVVPTTMSAHGHDVQSGRNIMSLGYVHLSNVDLNDLETVQTFSSLLLFKQDPMNSDLVIPASSARTIGGVETHIIRVLCRTLDLNVLFAEDQGIIISKRPELYERDSESYLSGIFKNAILTPSSYLISGRPVYGGVGHNGVNSPQYNSASALNRWSGI